MKTAESNSVVIGGIKRKIRVVEESWFECRMDRHHLCKGQCQYEATDVQKDKPVLVILRCNCDCHNRLKG